MRQVPWMVSCALAMSVAGSAGAEVVGYWDCNGIDPDVDTSATASVGSGIMDFASFGTGATSFAGTDLNALEGFVAGESLGLTGSSHNGAFAQFDISTVGKADLTFSFAARRSATGFGESHLDAWIGGQWTTIGSFNASTTAWTVISFDLASFDAIENGTASLRLVFDGASSGSGTIRFDNVLLDAGTSIPAPGALALLVGAAGAIGRRRRGIEVA